MPNSVMPKGVEHLDSDDTDYPVRFVPNSVMPKGVEHLFALFNQMGWEPCRIQ